MPQAINLRKARRSSADWSDFPFGICPYGGVARMDYRPGLGVQSAARRGNLPGAESQLARELSFDHVELPSSADSAWFDRVEVSAADMFPVASPVAMPGDTVRIECERVDGRPMDPAERTDDQVGNESVSSILSCGSIRAFDVAVLIRVAAPAAAVVLPGRWLLADLTGSPRCWTSGLSPRWRHWSATHWNSWNPKVILTTLSRPFLRRAPAQIEIEGRAIGPTIFGSQPSDWACQSAPNRR